MIIEDCCITTTTKKKRKNSSNYLKINISSSHNNLIGVGLLSKRRSIIKKLKVVAIGLRAASLV